MAVGSKVGIGSQAVLRSLGGGEGLGRECVRLFEGLKGQRVDMEASWKFARWYIVPGRVDDVRDKPSDFVGRVRNSVARVCCERLAGGHMSHIVPSHEAWFKWQAREGEFEDGELEVANEWYARCSDIALLELSRSNFYGQIFECFRDRVGLGTGGLYCSEGRSSRLFFQFVSPGQFCGEVDGEGRLVVFVRELMMSAYDVAAEWGEGALGEKMRVAYEDGGDKMYAKVFKVIQVVRRLKRAELGMMWECVYVDVAEGRVLCRSLEHEMPFMVTRWALNGGYFYGLPLWLGVAGVVEDLEGIERDLDKARRLAVDPRILELADEVGEVDLRAGGRTLVSPRGLEFGGRVFPQEWAAVGDVSLAYKQLADKERRVEEAFLVPMLDLFRGLDGKAGFPTATEIMARENQYLLQFFPSFVQFTADFAGMMDRIFMVLYRGGAFPEPPECVVKRVFNAQGVELGVAIKNPGVCYNNKVSLVLKRIESDGWVAAVKEAVELSNVAPGVLEHFDLDYGVRARARALGCAEAGLRSEADVEAGRDAAAAAQVEEAQLARSERLAKVGVDEAAAGKLRAEGERLSS